MDKYASTSSIYVYGSQGYRVKSASGQGQGQGHFYREIFNLRSLSALISVLKKKKKMALNVQRSSFLHYDRPERGRRDIWHVQ